MKLIYSLIIILALSIGFYIQEKYDRRDIVKKAKYSDKDYLIDFSEDKEFSNYFVLGSEVPRASSKTIDSLADVLESKKAIEFNLDVYGFQFGPIYDTLGFHYPPNYNASYWELGNLFSVSMLKDLKIQSVCSFNIEIDSPNNFLECLRLSSHSCDFVKSKNPTKFSNLKKLRQISFHRIELTQNDLEEVSKINNLSVFIANDCILDLKYLLPLKNHLKYIDLTKSLVSNIELISEFKNLEVVYLGSTSTTDFNWFVGMSNLKGLSVKRNKLLNSEALNQLDNLQKLFVSKSSIDRLPIDMLKKKDTEVVIIN